MLLIRCICLTIFISLSTLTSAESQENVSPEYTYFPHEDQFYLELMEHINPELQAIGLNYWNYHYDPEVHDDSVHQKMSKTFNQLKHKSNLPVSAFNELLNVCRTEKTYIKCDIEEIIFKQIRLYPQEATVYLLPLELALEEDNEADIFHLIKQMAFARSFDTRINYKQNFYDAVNEHITNNPHSQEGFDYLLEDYIDHFYRTVPPTKSELEQIQTLMPDYIKVLAKQFASLSKPIPNLRPLVVACSQYTELKDQCLNISKLMFSSAKSGLGKLVSLAIEEKVFRNSGQIELAEKAKTKKENLKAVFICLSNYELPRILDKSYRLYGQALAVTIKEGELAGNKHLAKLKYQKAKKEGDLDSKNLNPQLCYENVEEGYVEYIFDKE